MRGAWVAAFLIGIAVLLLAPASSLAANRYVFYAACGYTSSAQASHLCSKSSQKAAFFKSQDASVTYKVCVKYPNGQKLCASAQSAPKGKLKHNTITSSLKGAHRITWFVNDTKVGSWTLNVV
jgi:hypothetical protein